MIFKHLPLTLLFILPLGCGNYSNEDLDFQLALPQQHEMEAKLPQALTVDDSAEYYLKTREAVIGFNGTVTRSLDLIDSVRGYAPTTRLGNTRIWGPFPSEDYPNWEVRVVMERRVSATDPLLLTIAYVVQIRLKGTVHFTDLLTGSYESTQGSLRQGKGEIHWQIRNARRVSYPLEGNGVAEIDEVNISYEANPSSNHVRLEIINVLASTTRGGIYDYVEYPDASGQMTFDWYSAATPSLTAQIVSRWQGAGAGRADLIVTFAGLTFIRDTDCWGSDTRAAYVYRRDVTPSDVQGIPSACLFPAP